MARDVREVHSPYFRDFEFAAGCLTDGLDDGDPVRMRWDMLAIAEAQSGIWGGPDIRPDPKQKVEDLLPPGCDLTLLLLCRAYRALGFRLRVATNAKGQACEEKPWSDLRHGCFELHNAQVAASYLTSALAEPDEIDVQIALRNVIDSQGGIKKLAKNLGMQPPAIYEMLSGAGYPKATGFKQVIEGLGFAMKAEALKQAAAKAKAAGKARPARQPSIPQPMAAN